MSPGRRPEVSSSRISRSRLVSPIALDEVRPAAMSMTRLATFGLRYEPPSRTERKASSSPSIDADFDTKPRAPRDTRLQRAVSLGARGFVSKSASIEALLEAFRSVRDGGSYLSPNVASRVMDIAAGRTSSSAIGLTSREREILELLTSGRRPGDIADDLFLSVKTVKNHLTSVYQKLGVETGAQAVAEAYQRGIVHRS